MWRIATAFIVAATLMALPSTVAAETTQEYIERINRERSEAIACVKRGGTPSINTCNLPPNLQPRNVHHTYNLSPYQRWEVQGDGMQERAMYVPNTEGSMTRLVHETRTASGEKVEEREPEPIVIPNELRSGGDRLEIESIGFLRFVSDQYAIHSAIVSGCKSYGSWKSCGQFSVKPKDLFYGTGMVNITDHESYWQEGAELRYIPGETPKPGYECRVQHTGHRYEDYYIRTCNHRIGSPRDPILIYSKAGDRFVKGTMYSYVDYRATNDLSLSVYNMSDGEPRETNYISTAISCYTPGFRHPGTSLWTELPRRCGQ